MVLNTKDVCRPFISNEAAWRQVMSMYIEVVVLIHSIVKRLPIVLSLYIYGRKQQVHTALTCELFFSS